MLRSTISGLAIAGVVLFGPVPKANAIVILTFGQTGGSNTITATAVGGTTTITGTNVPVIITQIDAPGGPFNAFLNLTASNPVANSATIVGSDLRQSFSGTFSITSLAGGGGTNFLSGTFNDSLVGSGTGLSFSASTATAGENVTFTSSVIPPGDLGLNRAISLSLTNVTPSITAAGNTTFPSFTAAIGGNFSANLVPPPPQIPEPATLISAFTGLASLGLVKLRRRKAVVA